MIFKSSLNYYMFWNNKYILPGTVDPEKKYFFQDLWSILLTEHLSKQHSSSGVFFQPIILLAKNSSSGAFSQRSILSAEQSSIVACFLPKKKVFSTNAFLYRSSEPVLNRTGVITENYSFRAYDLFDNVFIHRICLGTFCKLNIPLLKP